MAKSDLRRARFARLVRNALDELPAEFRERIRNLEIVIEDERFPCEDGDAFFVPAKTEHRFENFTKDFATWAVFF